MDFARRPPTPDSPLTNRDSLYDATTTIDDLTQALENVSRVPSPEPPALFFCCCGRDDCENVQAWLGMKARLESRLTLSAANRNVEVGQALLQRHEAYVRRHESQHNKRLEMSLDEERESDDGAAAQDQLDELTKENKALEKRLTQALVNNEVTEVSNKTILQELAEAKITISRLTTSHARSVGWDTRLSAAMKEKDDMQQERDSESQRARLAESRFAALKERTSKLQSDVRRLQNALEDQREHRLESSESILINARARLEAVQRSVGMPLQEQPELMGVLETLVDDNETLKRDNAELQTLLADAREDCRALQEEVEDQQVNPPPPRSGAGTPSSHLRGHFHTGSVPAAMLSPTYNFNRSSSTERRSSRRYEPLTPETNRRPLSPTDSLTTSETKWTSFGQPQPRYPVSPSHASFDVEDQDADTPSALEKRTHKPLFLLARSRSVQTDPYPPPVAYPPSHSPSSATSVYSDSLAPSNNPGATIPSPSASFSALIERTTALLQRMQSADALSLTNRLKRQQIRGADVAHLSRSTVAGILADVGKQLRAGPQEDELRAGRRDVRALLGVLREIFSALGEMRVLLNEVVLDPASAGRISEAAMDPGKAHGGEGAGPGVGGAHGWMAPLSKLFAGAGGSPAPRGDVDRAATASPLAAPRPMPARFVPKLGPALAASATTVNVEFSGAGMGRAMTSTFDAPAAVAPVAGGSGAISPTPASGVMGIFAGAPRTRTPDPWVVIPNPKLPRRVPTSLLRPGMPAGGRHHAHRMSRNVDAVLDGVGTPARRGGDGDEEEPDYLGPLLERTLRRRGLSDSSIHSTFAAQEEDPVPQTAGGMTRREAAWLENGSVLQALSRRVQSFRSGLSGGAEREREREGASLSGSELGTSPPAPAAPIAVASGFGFLPTLANLVPSGEAAEMARSLREQDSGMMARGYKSGGVERDYL
ncbi:hypothetical protein DFH09DRAFT_1092922 [Mycena vulgaris]|nr:hypothetical protein DFH09DRAFT_1092922 [Mycena vulgaris]